jgi:hypothetical protein
MLNQLRLPFLIAIASGLLLVLIWILLSPDVDKNKGEDATPEALSYQLHKPT